MNNDTVRNSIATHHSGKALMHVAEVSDGVLISAACSKQHWAQQSDHISTLDVCHVLWPAAVEVLHTECHVTCDWQH